MVDPGDLVTLVYAPLGTSNYAAAKLPDRGRGGGGSLKRCALAGQPIQYEHHVSWLGLQKKPIQTFLQVVILLGTTVAPPRDIKSLPALNLFQMMVRHDLLET